MDLVVGHAGWHLDGLSFRKGYQGLVRVLRFSRKSGEDRLVTEGRTLVEAWSMAAEMVVALDKARYRSRPSLN